MLVPFEAMPKEEPTARRKQVTNAKRLQALTAAQDVLSVVLGRVGRIEGATVGASTSGAAQSEEEASDGSQPYVPNWPRVTRGSNLATAEDKLEWLQNCLLPIVLEEYMELGASSMIDLGVQSALLVRNGCMEE